MPVFAALFSLSEIVLLGAVAALLVGAALYAWPWARHAVVSRWAHSQRSGDGPRGTLSSARTTPPVWTSTHLSFRSAGRTSAAASAPFSSPPWRSVCSTAP